MISKKIIGVVLGVSLSAGLIGTAFIRENKNKVEQTVAASKDTYWNSWISNNSTTIAKGGSGFVSILKTKITQVADGNSNTVSYDGLWNAYKTADAVPGSGGAKIWDMYGGFQFNYQTGGGSNSPEGAS